MYSLPNILTISRIVVIPVIFLSIYIHAVWWSIFAGILFIVAAITDYFDGYLARSRNETSAFGRLLDPIADKLLVVSALLIIVANQMVDELSYIPVGIIMCREVLVSGLREFLAEVKVGMPVTRLAKWKTGFQMTALSMILMGRIGIIHIGDSYIPFWGVLGEILLWVAGVLTFMTGYDYFKKSLDYIRGLEENKPAKVVNKKAKEATKKVAKVVKSVKAEKKVEAQKEIKQEVKADAKPGIVKKTASKKASSKKTAKKAASKKTVAKKVSAKTASK